MSSVLFRVLAVVVLLGVPSVIGNVSDLFSYMASSGTVTDIGAFHAAARILLALAVMPAAAMILWRGEKWWVSFKEMFNEDAGIRVLVGVLSMIMLADAIVYPDNPLVSRIILGALWMFNVVSCFRGLIPVKDRPQPPSIESIP